MEIKFPELGEGIEKAIVSHVYKKEGDVVHEGDDLVELTTDKATFGVCSEQSGILKELRTHQGQEVSLNQVLAVVE